MNNLEFETLHSNKHRIYFLIGFVCVVVLLVVFIVSRSHAKYRVVESIPLVKGTINYTPYDFKMVAMYQEDGNGEYVSIDKVPTNGYELNTEQSYCEVNDTKDNNIQIEYESGAINFLGMTSKGTKCYLYFDEQKGNTMSEIIGGYNIGNRGSFNSVYTTSTTKTVFQTTDWKGTSYYFAGAPTDNWVHFGGFYWRIVRVNGDGTIRLIYNGTSTTTTGTMINNGINQQFNSNYDRSEYAGLKYTTGQQHGQNTDSLILDTLQSWYTSSGLSAVRYSQHIDTNIGFCSDRNMASGSSWSSQPSSTIYYAAYERLFTNKSPNLACESSDIIKEPVGLITADEVSMAGGVWGINNSSYYLYNNQIYWLLSPSNFSATYNVVGVFVMLPSGNLYSYWVNDDDTGVRPVINLKADTKFTGDGTIDNPYVVS